MALWTIKRIPKVPGVGDQVEAITFDDSTDGDIEEVNAKLREQHPDHNIFIDHYKPTRPDENIPGTSTPNGSAQEKIAEIAKNNPNTPEAAVGAAGIGDNVLTSTVETVDGTKTVAHDPAGPDAPFKDQGAVGTTTEKTETQQKTSEAEKTAETDSAGTTAPDPAAKA